MSSGEVIQVQDGRVLIALRKLQLNLQRREEMYRAMGASMLVSIRRTFRESGSPAGSWVPLAASTIARNPKKYGGGHKLLIDRGVLLNSITFHVVSTGVILGTNLIYAAVHNFGSRDRGGSIGPQARLADRSVKVKAHFRTVNIAPRYEMKEITRADGTTVRVPRAMRVEQAQIVDKNGRRRTVSRLIADPGLTKTGAVGSHSRYQNIPARPYMVLRPEDPNRLRGIAVQFVNKAKADAGLAGA